jgi:hypothetical protein
MVVAVEVVEAVMALEVVVMIVVVVPSAEKAVVIVAIMDGSFGGGGGGGGAISSLAIAAGLAGVECESLWIPNLVSCGAVV